MNNFRNVKPTRTEPARNYATTRRPKKKTRCPIAPGKKYAEIPKAERDTSPGQSGRRIKRFSGNGICVSAG